MRERKKAIQKEVEDRLGGNSSNGGGQQLQAIFLLHWLSLAEPMLRLSAVVARLRLKCSYSALEIALLVWWQQVERVLFLQTLQWTHHKVRKKAVANWRGSMKMWCVLLVQMKVKVKVSTAKVVTLKKQIWGLVVVLHRHIIFCNCYVSACKCRQLQQ